MDKQRIYGIIDDRKEWFARASEAIIIAFHVVPEPHLQRKADEFGVDIRTYRIIYNVLDDIRAARDVAVDRNRSHQKNGWT